MPLRNLVHPQPSLPHPLPSQQSPSFRTMLKRRNQGVGLLPAPSPGPSHSKHLRHSQSGPLLVQPLERRPDSCLSKKEVDTNEESVMMATNRSTLYPASAQASLEAKTASCCGLERTLLVHEDSLKCGESVGLEELRARMEQVVRVGLESWEQGEGEKSWNSGSKLHQIEQQLAWVQDFLSKPSHQQTLAGVLARLQLLEQMIALQSAQAYSLRQNYFAKLAHSSSLNSHSRVLLGKSLEINQQLPGRATPQPAKEYLWKCSSTASQSFLKPSRESYVPPVKVLRPYKQSREPTALSSYQVQFPGRLVGPVLPSQSPLRLVLPQTSLSVKVSSYQLSFGCGGGTAPLDYHQFDCSKDKIRRLQVSFMESSRKEDRWHCPKNKENLYLPARNLPLACGVPGLGGQLKTEQQRSYMAGNNQDRLRSVPKNQQLLRLKEEFRQLAQTL